VIVPRMPNGETRCRVIETATMIREVCASISDLLVQKNASYGDSAFEPLRIFSKADPCEQLLVRIDDKLSRWRYGSPDGEDTLTDLIGYLILLKVTYRRNAEK
jgi:hypothetical protein